MTGYAVAAALGGAVGLAELVSRYRDEPGSALRVLSAWLYVALNAGASAAALLLTHTFGWTFGAEGAAAGTTQVLVASFGAIAFFRSSLFTVRVGEQDVGIGPSTVLATLLGAADRDVDRHRAEDRSAAVGQIMRGVSFDKAKIALPTYALGLLQNLPLEDQGGLRNAVNLLDSTGGMTDRQKSLALGLLLLNLVGTDVLRAAVSALADDIAESDGDG